MATLNGSLGFEVRSPSVEGLPSSMLAATFAAATTGSFFPSYHLATSAKHQWRIGLVRAVAQHSHSLDQP